MSWMVAAAVAWPVLLLILGWAIGRALRQADRRAERRSVPGPAPTGVADLGGRSTAAPDEAAQPSSSAEPGRAPEPDRSTQSMVGSPAAGTDRQIS